MSALTFSVDHIDSIDPAIAPNYGVRSLTITARATEDQMCEMLMAVREESTHEQWAKWLAQVEAEFGL